MDLVDSCKDKLGHFRIRELKDVLTQLGLSKQGKKQDLVSRILGAMSEDQGSNMWSKKNIGKEEVARFVDDIYRKMQVSGATDLATKALGQGAPETSNVKIKGELEDPFQSDTKVRCPCGSYLETDSMIMCEDSSCHVWQHMSCVLIPEKPMEGDLPIPEVFYCELCRLSRADPFWVSVSHPLNPVKLTISSIPTDGTNPMQTMERTFYLTRADKDLLTKAEYDVQAWCMLLNDKVPFRMQWPQYADLHINGVPVRAINRPGSQLLGANGRDDGQNISPCTKDGVNKISVTGCDARIFCVGVRVVKRRTVQQILNLIPKETDGEPFEDALSRVCRCVGGATEADSDSDIEVVADTFTVNLRCPMSGSRMKVAGRFKPCIHMGCFDLDVFVEMNQRSRKWQCPICLKNYSLENIIIDPYFNRITSMMRHCGEDVTEIDVKPEGSWRVKSKSESDRRGLGDLCQWHLSDGTLCVPTREKLQPMAELMKQVKQEGGSEVPTGLKLRISQNREGLWKVSKPPKGINNSSGNSRLHDAVGDPEQKVTPMSNSITHSGRDGDDPSVNENGGGHFDLSNEIELDSIPYNVDPVFGFPNQNLSTAPVGDAEVIILSDSDEENDVLITSTSGDYKGNQENGPNGILFSQPHTSIVDSFEDPILVNGNSPCLGLFSSNEDEFGQMPRWSLPPETQVGPSFELFNANGDVSEPLYSPMRYKNLVAPDSGMGPVVMLTDPSAGPSSAHLNDHLVHNPLAMDRGDPSLQIFLPTRPSGASVQSNMRDEANTSNGIHTEDYLSLSLGGHGDNSATEANGFNSRQLQIPPQNGGALDSLADTASLLLGMNDGNGICDNASRKRSDSPFSFPRQRRSVRPRLYLSIDSDTD